jgi:dihydrofolate reductase
MRKIVVSESVTVDGVFDAETMGQWAYPYYSDERDAFVRETIFASDALLFGRATYDLQAYYWPSQKTDKYGIADRKNAMSKYVVSTTLPKAEWNNTTIIKENVLEEIGRLKQQPGQNILVEGSATLVESLAQANLVDEYWLLVHPTIVGSGKHFFKSGTGMSKLKLVTSKTLSLGVVLLGYEAAN